MVKVKDLAVKVHPALPWLPYLFVYIGAVVYTQYFLNAGFYTDQRIYQEAATKAGHGASPYLPFNIPASFVYPPAILPLFAAFNYISFDLARILWADLNLVIYLAVLLVMWNWLKPQFNFRSLVIFGMLLFYGPLSEDITIGQVDCINLLGFALFVYSLAPAPKRSRWWGGLGLAGASLIKFTPGLLGLVLVRHRLWKGLWNTLISAVLLSSFSVIFFGWTVWLDFARIVPDLVVSGSSDINNQRITNTLAVFLKTAEDNPTVRQIGSGFSLVILGTWLAVLLLRSSKEDLEPVALLGIVSLTISSSLVWYHHFLFLVLPIMYLLFRYENSWLVWLGWAGLSAIQLDRVVEHAFKWPPLLSQVGYTTIFVAMIWINLRPIKKVAKIILPARPVPQAAKEPVSLRP